MLADANQERKRIAFYFKEVRIEEGKLKSGLKK